MRNCCFNIFNFFKKCYNISFQQHAKKNFQGRESSNLAAVLDLADAFAYVDGISTQNTSGISPDRETWVGP